MATASTRLVASGEWFQWKHLARKYAALGPREMRKRLARIKARDPVMAEGIRRFVEGRPPH